MIASANTSIIPQKDGSRIGTIFRRAEEGDIDAQATLGLMFETGFGLHRDARNAARWYLEAAHRGDIISQYCLAEMLLEGREIDRDVGRGTAWLRSCATEGMTEAQLKLGVLLLEEPEIFDASEACHWLKRAADAGEILAASLLSRLLAGPGDWAFLARSARGRALVREWVDHAAALREQLLRATVLHAGGTPAARDVPLRRSTAGVRP